MKTILCPHCGEKTLPKEKKIFDDAFHVKEVKKVCGFCGGEIAPANSGAEGVQGKAAAAAERLSALLGGEKAEKISFAPDAADGRNCLHCRHYIKHPFMDRCAITLQEIDVMGSCGKFEPR